MFANKGEFKVLSAWSGNVLWDLLGCVWIFSNEVLIVADDNINGRGVATMVQEN